MTAVFPVLPGHDIAGHYFQIPMIVPARAEQAVAGISTEPPPPARSVCPLDPASAAPLPGISAGVGVEWVPFSTRRRYLS